MKKFKLPTVPAIVAILLLAVVFNSQAQETKKIKTNNMESIAFIKELDCHIDLSKIVEISTLKQMPVIEIITGTIILPNGYFESDNYRKQGQFYFIITYQLKTPVKHWINMPKNEAEKIYLNLLSIWRQSLNNR